MAGPVELRAELFAHDQVIFAGRAGEVADAFTESDRLIFGRITKEPGIAQIVERQERVVVPAPITVHVTDVALAPLAISGVPNDQPGRVPLFERRAGRGQEIM